MTKIISTTFLLKNPAKVREMIKKGIELLVKFEGVVVMKITIPDNIKKNTAKLPPVFNSGMPDYVFNREEIYSHNDDKY